MLDADDGPLDRSDAPRLSASTSRQRRVARHRGTDLPCTSTASGSLESTTAPAARAHRRRCPTSAACAPATSSATFRRRSRSSRRPAAHVRVREHRLRGSRRWSRRRRCAARASARLVRCDRVRHVARWLRARSPWRAASRRRGSSGSRWTRTCRCALPVPSAGSKTGARRPSGARCRRPAIVSRLTRACTANPRAANPWTGGSPPSPRSASDSPAASRSCACTRSTPVTSSVTVCSTCSRAFASMNQCESPLTRNSIRRRVLVGRLRVRCAGRPRPAASRTAGSRCGAGAISMIFWWRRWMLQSRSPRWTTSPLLVAEHLHLDVADCVDELLDVQPHRRRTRLSPPTRSA